jgi:type I restriction enzyme S subunit
LGNVLSQRVERCIASAETASRPYVPIDCISPQSLFLTESKPGEEAQSSLTKFYKGDLLFGAMRPYFHKVCITPFDGTTRTTAFVLYPRQANDFAFATLLLHHPDTIDFATRHSTGSTIPYAVWTGSLEDMPVPIPPAQVRNVFNNAVRPILVRIAEPYFENRTLAALRDTLLPKQISGELRVMTGRQIAEAVP